MKILSLWLLGLLLSTYALAQNPYVVKGGVTDTAATYKMVNAAVTILNQKDSTLVKFTRVNPEGAFSLTNLRAGKFIMLITYPGYADYTEDFALDSMKPVKDFGPVNLVLKSTLLEGVIIQGKVAAIKIKGDTTEFNAGSYTIQANDKVEDLLKQLPGITIDKDGKITAQGKAVNKVLVDGEEFFGDDPTLVTKNLRADMVDKVQLYDKKSDQATFTGIDDGVKDKTINIKLKEDKKNGYFGKTEASGGTNKFYGGQAMLNIFKGKERFSGYGILSNTGTVGLGWDDNSKYSSSGGMSEVTDDGGIMFYMDGGDDLDSWDGRYNGQGIPTAKVGGLHYENKWDNDKHGLNTNYKIGSIGVKGSRNTLTQNNLPTGLLNSNSDQLFDNQMFRQKLDATYTLRLDSTSTLRFTVDGTNKNSKTNDQFGSSNRRADSTLLNTSERFLNNDEDQQLFNAGVLWTKKLKKKGRTLSLNVKQSLTKSDAEGYLRSTNQFFNASSALDSTQRINQYKTNNSESAVTNANLTYTEPLSKLVSLTLNYGLNINNSSSNRQSYNQSASGSYDLPDPLFSNDYQFNQLSNQGGANFNYRKDKTTVRLGTKVNAVKFNQIDGYTGQSFKRDFINWNPQASYQYRFSQQRSVSIDYSGRTQQPQISQVQPILVNTDPLNITLGNPNLRPSFSNYLNVYYSSYKILTEQSLWVSASYGIETNSITNNTVTDAAGKTTYQAVNLSDRNSSNFNIYASSDKKIKALDINVGLEVSGNGSTSFNMVNDALNESRYADVYGKLYVRKNKEKMYNLNMGVGPAYTAITSSLQNTGSKGWGLDANYYLSIYLPGKIEINSDGVYTYKAQTQAFNDRLERFIVNAGISKKFLKTDALKMSIRANDLLNQNNGFTRSAYGNMITQNRFTTIKRYFMGSITWDFNKMGGTTKK
ncbi:outer membrane beta-barrel family protein [Pedobacter sp. PWIIR3]